MKLTTLFILFILGLAQIIGCEDEPPNLDSRHEGWQQPDCHSCHTGSHHQNDDPHECADCHGNNGAPDYPDDHTPEDVCEACHNAIHGDDGFPVPESCLNCHS